MTLEEIMREYGFLRRPAMDFLDLLVSVNLLGREGDGLGARYQNTEETAAFLDRNKSTYIGGIIEIWDKRNYRYWADITEGFKTGKPQNETKEAGTYRRPGISGSGASNPCSSTFRMTWRSSSLALRPASVNASTRAPPSCHSGSLSRAPCQTISGQSRPGISVPVRKRLEVRLG